MSFDPVVVLNPDGERQTLKIMDAIRIIGLQNVKRIRSKKQRGAEEWVRLRRKRDQWKTYLAKMKEDPERYEEYLERKRRNRKANKEKRLNNGL